MLLRSSLLLLLLAACSSARTKTNDKTKEYADKICACTDYACARPIWREYLNWMSTDESRDKSAPVTPDLDRLMACAKATGALN